MHLIKDGGEPYVATHIFRYCACRAGGNQPRSAPNKQRFMQAVAFALTGQDDGPVRVIDLANCVFMIDQKVERSHEAGEVYHLNNVQVDRISIVADKLPYAETFHLNEWDRDRVVADKHTEQQFGTIVRLVGAATVYSYQGQFPIDSEAESSHFDFRIWTDDTERVVRAWRYIYANGCKGARSAF
jgi:hypothetical protein